MRLFRSEMAIWDVPDPTMRKIAIFLIILTVHRIWERVLIFNVIRDHVESNGIQILINGTLLIDMNFKSPKEG
jgi:hypothetical protein